MPGGSVVQSASIGPSNPTSMFGNPATFTAAANTQASDYDRIMQQYSNLAKSYAINPISANPISSNNVQAQGNISPSAVNYNQINPQLSQYEQSEDVTGSLAKLSDLAATGGYSAGDIQNIRARDISPIRSIYANAQQNTERARALGGGYSPNFNAVQSQMARDEANKIGDVTTAANAGIAQNVVTNKLAAAPAYASASSRANDAQTAADQRNADIINQINQFNTQGYSRANELNAANQSQTNQFNASMAASNAEANTNREMQVNQFNTQAALDAAKSNRQGAMGAIQGQASLYGTTPALTNLFGNQVVQAGQLGQGQQQLNNQKMNVIGNFGR
jgi:hypothetical protein